MRIDFILRSNAAYTLEKYATAQLRRAFEKMGVETREIVLDDKNAFQQLRDDPPDWSFSFADFQGVANVPHFFWNMGCLSRSLHLLKNPLVHIGNHDLRLVNAVNKWKNQVSFLPPAVSPDLAPQEKVYDLVIFANLRCLDAIQNTWKELFSAEEIALFRAVIALSHESTTPFEVMLQLLQEKPLETQYSLSTLLSAVEEYLNAKKLIEFLENMPPMRTHIFGDHIGNNWLKKLKNIHLHAPLHYIDHIEILKRAKRLLDNSEWNFAAILLDCMPLSTHVSKEEILQNHTFEKRAHTLLLEMERARANGLGLVHENR